MSTRSYVNTVRKARARGYFVTILYFWLNSPNLAIERVKTRVQEGGHDIPEPVIRRRYDLGIKNMFNLYIPIADYWMFIDNSSALFNVIAEGSEDTISINNSFIWNKLKEDNHGN